MTDPTPDPDAPGFLDRRLRRPLHWAVLGGVLLVAGFVLELLGTGCVFSSDDGYGWFADDPGFFSSRVEYLPDGPSLLDVVASAAVLALQVAGVALVLVGAVAKGVQVGIERSRG